MVFRSHRQLQSEHSLHSIAYDGEEEHCFFNLQEDLAMDDLIN